MSLSTSEECDGWWYSHVGDEIRANLPGTEVDDQGVPYNTY